ncbi:hypothetical protein ENBRE01_0963 [Enteropsectra breve]|nr:hypothetical protein ENBRE01_0963 [Enteropsectra breve]
MNLAYGAAANINCQQYRIPPDSCMAIPYYPGANYSQFLSSYHMPLANDGRCEGPNCPGEISSNECAGCDGKYCSEKCKDKKISTKELLEYLKEAVQKKKKDKQVNYKAASDEDLQTEKIAKIVKKMSAPSTVTTTTTIVTSISSAAPVVTTISAAAPKEAQPSSPATSPDQKHATHQTPKTDNFENYKPTPITPVQPAHDDCKNPLSNPLACLMILKELQNKVLELNNKKKQPKKHITHSGEECTGDECSDENKHGSKSCDGEECECTGEDCKHSGTHSEKEGISRKESGKIVTVTRNVTKTRTVEAPITLYREVTTTVEQEKPITNYKVTTYTVHDINTIEKTTTVYGKRRIEKPTTKKDSVKDTTPEDGSSKEESSGEDSSDEELPEEKQPLKQPKKQKNTKQKREPGRKVKHGAEDSPKEETECTEDSETAHNSVLKKCKRLLEKNDPVKYKDPKKPGMTPEMDESSVKVEKKETPVKSEAKETPAKTEYEKVPVMTIYKEVPIKSVPKDEPLKSSISKDEPVKSTVAKDEPLKSIPKEETAKSAHKEELITSERKDVPIKTLTVTDTKTIEVVKTVPQFFSSKESVTSSMASSKEKPENSLLSVHKNEPEKIYITTTATEKIPVSTFITITKYKQKTEQPTSTSAREHVDPEVEKKKDSSSKRYKITCRGNEKCIKRFFIGKGKKCEPEEACSDPDVKQHLGDIQSRIDGDSRISENIIYKTVYI